MTVKLYCKYGEHRRGTVVSLAKNIEKSLVDQRLADYVTEEASKTAIQPLTQGKLGEQVEEVDGVNLSDLTIEQIETMLKDINDLETLNELLEDEKSEEKPRTGAIKAIENRIKEVSGDGL